MRSVRSAVLLVATIISLVLAGQAFAEKELLVVGTVDCGLPSGQRCSIDRLLKVWTTDVTGERALATIDVSWVQRQLNAYDQDDPVCVEVRVEADGTLRAIGIPECPESEQRRPEDGRHRKDREEKESESTILSSAGGATPTPSPTVTPTATGTASPTATGTLAFTSTPTATSSATSTLTPTVTSTPTATPIVANVRMLATGLIGNCTETACALTFTITVTNDGPSTATNIAVTTAQPDLVCTGSAATGTANPTGTNWTVPSLTAGASTTLTLACTADRQEYPFVVTAEVIAVDQADPNSTPNNHNPDEDDQVTVSLRENADLTVFVTGDSIVCAAVCTVTWTVTVHNDGSGTATDVVLQITPANYTIAAGVTADGTFNSATGIWNVPFVTPDGTDAVLTLTGTGSNVAPSFSTTAEIIASANHDPDSTPNNHNPAEDDQATDTLP